MNDLHADDNPNGHEQEYSEDPFPDFDPSQPLPPYTQSWGDFLRRPSKLPDNYDTRIDPNHIFVFAVHPITGIKRDFYVTPKPCEYCAKIRQVCSRSRPFCHRCMISGDPERVCNVEEGWVKLPGPKCEKPRLQKRLPSVPGPKPAPSSSSSPSSAPAPKRARTIAPQPLEDGLSSHSSTPTPTVTNLYEPMAIPKKPPPKRVAPVTRSENIGAAVPRPVNTSAGGVPAKGRPVRPQSTPKAVARTGKRGGRKAGGKDTESQDGVWTAPDRTTWHTLHPPLASYRLHPPNKPRPSIQHRPRIWAKDKTELLQILPELSDALRESGSGIYMEPASLEPPIVYLANSAWPDDSMDSDGRSAAISFVRDFSVVKQRPIPQSGKPVDFTDDQDMMLVDEVPSHNPSRPAPLLTSNAQPPPRQRVQALHPSRALTNNINQPPVNSKPSTSDSLNGQNHMEPAGPGIRRSYSPLQERAPEGWHHPPPTNTPSMPSDRSSHVSPPSLSHRGTGLTGAFGGDHANSHQGNWPLPLPNHPPLAALAHTSSQASTNTSGCTFAIPKLEFAWKEMLGNVKCKLSPAVFPQTDSANSDASGDSDNESGSNSLHNGYISSSANGGSQGLEPESFMRKMNEINRQLIDAIPEVAPEKAALAQTQEQQEFWEKHVPNDLPPEIKHLQDCKTYGIPLVLTVARDYPALPFELPPDCGIAVMGFYKITDMTREVEVQSDDGTRRKSRVTWRLALRWIPGGEDGPEDKQPLHPWWEPAPPDSAGMVVEPAPSDRAKEPVDLSPYSLLPMHLRDDSQRPVDENAVASEVHTCKGWHCTTCGRLNVQRLLGAQKCGTCGTGNGMLPVDALYVRDPHKTMPDSTPVDTYPESVTHHVLDGARNSTRTFVYTLGEGVEVKHVFTCNRPAAQAQAHELFRDIQRQVPMAWQDAKTKLATGPYYTYLAGPGHEPHAAAVSWPQTPVCLQRARSIMEEYARERAGEEDFRADTLTVLGWTAPGNRKSPTPLPARRQPLAILCLGADVELQVAPVSGYGKSSPPVMKRAPSVVARQIQDTMTRALGGDPFDSPLSNASSDEEALSVRRLSTRTAKSAPRSKAKKPAETVLVTLVHGDMVIFGGDDFEYSLHRTGMSIILIAMPWAGTHGQVSDGRTL